MAIYWERIVVGAIAGDSVDTLSDGWARLDNPLAYLTFYPFGDVELCVGAVFVEELVGKTVKIFSRNSELRFSVNGNVVL
jgi:hypothetical protein